MKMKSAGDLMKDPFYSQMMYGIENLIHDRDLAAQSVDLTVKDSDAKSAIRKALGILNGRPPKTSKESMRHEWVQETAKGLIALGQALKTEEGIEDAHFKRALVAVEDSLKTRREMYGHSRGYMDFLQRFIEDQQIT